MMEPTRERLNNLLRYTKDMRMIGYLYFSSHIDGEMVDAATYEFDSIVQQCDNDTAALIARIRRQACEVIFLYMAATSLGFISAAILVVVSALPQKVLNALKQSIRSVFEFKPSTIEYAAMR